MLEDAERESFCAARSLCRPDSGDGAVLRGGEMTGSAEGVAAAGRSDRCYGFGASFQVDIERPGPGGHQNGTGAQRPCPSPSMPDHVSISTSIAVHEGH